MNLVFVGGGHITRAILGGLVGASQASGVVVVERNADKRQQLETDFNVRTAAVFSGETPDAVVIAVRPTQVQAACAQIADCGALFISVAAGLRNETLAGWLNGGRTIRAMPNTPSQVGVGMTFCCAGEGTTAADRQLTEMLFSTAGKVAWLTDEMLLNAAVAVSGSGPAYIYYFIESMRATAVKMNLPEEVALEAVLQTFRGAVAMVEKGERTAEELWKAVAVPGGATERALAVFEAHQQQNIIAEAMHACAARAKEMGAPPSSENDNS